MLPPSREAGIDGLIRRPSGDVLDLAFRVGPTAIGLREQRCRREDRGRPTFARARALPAPAGAADRRRGFANLLAPMARNRFAFSILRDAIATETTTAVILAAV